MRRLSHDPAHTGKANLAVLKMVAPRLWEYRARVTAALTCLVIAKMATVGVPLAFKHIVDVLDAPGYLVVPLALLFTYGILRIAGSFFAELRDAVFAQAAQRIIRQVALDVFVHLHQLSLRFHLDRKTGGVSRDIERGTRGMSFLLTFMLFNILPTLVELGLVIAILLSHYDWRFTTIIVGTIAVYIAFTLLVTNKRLLLRRVMNLADSNANQKSMDSLLNFETVKYFGNEAFEAARYDESLKEWEKAAVRSQISLAVLNAGQGLIIAIGVTLLMWLASRGVVSKTMTLGDLVLVNGYLLQLYAPLNMLGFIYREIRNALADMDRMFGLLAVDIEVKDTDEARPLEVRRGEVRFSQVSFAYEANRQILDQIDFVIPAGRKIAIVGASGGGKSTIARLLFRFYDSTAGKITIDDQDIRLVTQTSLREAIGVVPQDTVLFNDTIYYNIAYGRTSATRQEVEAAARLAHLHDFIMKLPQGYDTPVGERGLKLSGGEKQRVAIARALLKNPPILILDEATSALDSESERAIQEALVSVANNRTTLVIAHRLSTIIDAEQILVIDQGRIVERGTHSQLLTAEGLYAGMWALQQNDDVAGAAAASVA